MQMRNIMDPREIRRVHRQAVQRLWLWFEQSWVELLHWSWCASAPSKRPETQRFLDTRKARTAQRDTLWGRRRWAVNNSFIVFAPTSKSSAIIHIPHLADWCNFPSLPLLSPSSPYIAVDFFQLPLRKGGNGIALNTVMWVISSLHPLPTVEPLPLRVTIRVAIMRQCGDAAECFFSSPVSFLELLHEYIESPMCHMPYSAKYYTSKVLWLGLLRHPFLLNVWKWFSLTVQCFCGACQGHWPTYLDSWSESRSALMDSVCSPFSLQKFTQSWTALSPLTFHSLYEMQ